MARYKRYFPVSQDLNHDPEIIELVKKFGAPGLQLWLEILSIADRSGGTIKVSKYWLDSVSKLVCCRFATGLQIINKVVANGWLTPSKPFTSDQEIIYTVSNYAEYHRMRVPKSENSRAPNLTLPNLTLPKDKEKNILTDIPKEKVTKGPTNIRKPWPKDFILTEELREYAIKQGILDPESEFEHFHDHALAKGYKYVDWARAWQTWCRSPYQRQTKAQEYYA